MSKVETQLRRIAKASGASMLSLSTSGKVSYPSVHSFVTGKRGLSVAGCEGLAKALGYELRLVRVEKGARK
jgi:hypothetical protein